MRFPVLQCPFSYLEEIHVDHTLYSCLPCICTLQCTNSEGLLCSFSCFLRWLNCQKKLVECVYSTIYLVLITSKKEVPTVMFLHLTKLDQGLYRFKWYERIFSTMSLWHFLKCWNIRRTIHSKCSPLAPLEARRGVHFGHRAATTTRPVWTQRLTWDCQC